MITQKRPRRYAALLSSIYENPKSPASFSSPYRLYLAAKEKDKSLSLKDVYRWLSTREAYTKYRDIKIKFPRRMVLTRGIDYLWQADLLDYSPVSKENSGIHFLLTVIDCFSRYAIAVPMKDKSASSSVTAFIKVLNVTKSKPKKLQTDQGKEFTNSKFQSLLAEKKIHWYYTKSEIKASLVERFNRTLRARIKKYMVTKRTLRYLDVLPDLIIGYNKTKHSSLEKYAPEEVNGRNEKEVFNILYGEYFAKRKKLLKLNIGDTVRVTKYRKTFKKSDEQNFTDELFTIVDTRATQPPTYILKDKNNVIIEGPFYEQEIQLVTKV